VRVTGWRAMLALSVVAGAEAGMMKESEADFNH
jgi:hypothetical protein